MAVCGAGSKVGERLHAVLAPGTMSQWRAPLRPHSAGRGLPRRRLHPGAGDAATESAASRKSVQHGALDPGSCEKALKKLKVPHVAAPGARKIAQPVILTGPIDDVHFDTGRPYDQRTIAAGDAIDCRLAVSLVDLARTVKKHGVTHVMVKSFHRPNQVIVDPGAPLRRPHRLRDRHQRVQAQGRQAPRRAARLPRQGRSGHLRQDGGQASAGHQRRAGALADVLRRRRHRGLRQRDLAQLQRLALRPRALRPHGGPPDPVLP